MALLLFLLLAVGAIANAQPLVVLDKEWKEPLTLTEHKGQPLDWQHFPVYQADIDAVIGWTKWFIEALEEGRQMTAINEIKEAGASRFIGFTNSYRKNPGFQLNLVTRCGNLGYSMALVETSDGRKKGLQKLRAFLDYLRNNRFLVAAPH